MRKNLTKIFHKKGIIVLTKDILVLKDILQKYSNDQHWASPLPPKGLPLDEFKFHGESNCYRFGLSNEAEKEFN